MWNTRKISKSLSVLCGIFGLLVPGVAWSGLQGPAYEVYNQVLDKLEHLTPDNTIAIDIGVNPKNYRERFEMTDGAIALLRQANVPEDVLTKLTALTGKFFFTQNEFATLLESTLGKEANDQYGTQITQVADAGTAVYAFNDAVEIWFQVSQPCYLTMMHIAGDEVGGAITFLLPNQKSPDLKIEANTPYSTNQFGLHFIVTPPETSEVVNLFCSQAKIDWFGADIGRASHYIISPTDEQRLQSFSHKLDELEKMEWAGTGLNIRISPTLPPPGGLTRGNIPVRRKGAVPPIGATGTTGKGKFFPPIGATGTTGKQ